MESVHRNPPTSSDMLNSLILCKTLSDSYRNEKKSYRKRIFSTISFQLCIEYHKRIIYARRFPARCSLFLLCVSALFRYLLSAQHKNSSEKFISKLGNTMQWETRAKWLQRFYVRSALNRSMQYFTLFYCWTAVAAAAAAFEYWSWLVACSAVAFGIV